MIVMPHCQWLSSMLFQISLHVVSFISTWNRSDWMRFDLSNKFLFFAIVPATFLFYAHLAPINLTLTVNTKTGTNIIDMDWCNHTFLQLHSIHHHHYHHSRYSKSAWTITQSMERMSIYIVIVFSSHLSCLCFTVTSEVWSSQHSP